MKIIIVHCPDEKLLEAISWSADLDTPFTNNYKHNPTLSWQYFGSSTGFLRQFPGNQPINHFLIILQLLLANLPIFGRKQKQNPKSSHLSFEAALL